MNMVDEYMKELELIMEEKQKTQDLNKDYGIYVIWKTDRCVKNIYVTGMFRTVDEMVELGLNNENRKVLALTPHGFKELRKMGFKSKEILIQYETN